MNVGLSKDLAKSDTTVNHFGWLMVVTTAGSVVYTTAAGEDLTLASVPVGVWLPMGKCIRIKTASTAVGFIVA